MKDEIIRVGEVGIRFLLEAADTNGSVAIFEFTVPAEANVFHSTRGRSWFQLRNCRAGNGLLLGPLTVE